jgi:hypothetical protein
VRIGEWNVAIGVVGGPGCGKSTYAQFRARQIIASTPCYVVAHDPTMSVRGADVSRHSTESQLIAALRGPRARGIHCLDVADGLRAIKLGLEVAEMARAAKDPIPTLVLLDEIVTVGNMSPSFMDPVMQEAYALRRHRHIGFVFCSQRPQQAHPTIWELSTEIVMFRIPTKRQIDRFADLGVPESTLAQVPNLAKYAHIIHKM